MKKFIQTITNTNLEGKLIHIALLIFRIALSLELIFAHGLKKLGIGVVEAEKVPNPLNLPEAFNSLFADSANLFFPVFVILGFLTRAAVLPILAVTLTGYFVLHWNDALLIKDTPFMYSLCYLFLLFVGPGKYSIDHYIIKKLQ
ncbi:DoxX family protein [Chryseobacterium indologenes]|uniref:DoxX family protein n=1 Tax=Chryseobacterium indologenes TaxID=253 RepID=UPI000F4F314D|nr:DoxX family protein [Chryseobacterium indologenes]AYZ35064.1 DoxX family protein [Chryseobacterium indologenes]MBF6643811.1 DoxX family protein [Chryseobacterium indologenes]MBU3048441.1 DoxX family protein [Chryseobacterium indologenes]MEB4762849.1 DoxX family protein [Chryseobacterium indologenes]QQQ72458.1 DoxX family protein [Chryseobacterium indologenes]